MNNRLKDSATVDPHFGNNTTEKGGSECGERLKSNGQQATNNNNN
jgi:hypothetical protein